MKMAHSEQRKKGVGVMYLNKQIWLGTFPVDEANKRLERAQSLVNRYLKKRGNRPTYERVVEKLEKKGLRAVVFKKSRGKKIRGENEYEMGVGGNGDEGADEHPGYESDDESRFSRDGNGNVNSGDTAINNGDAENSDGMEEGHEDAGNSSPSPPLQLNHRLLSSPKRKSQHHGNSRSKRKKSPYASMDEKNEIQLGMKDDRYKNIIMKYADSLERTTASDRHLKSDKIYIEASKAYEELSSGAANLVSPGKWGRWCGLDDGEFKVEAIKKITSNIRNEVLNRRKPSSEYDHKKLNSNDEVTPKKRKTINESVAAGERENVLGSLTPKKKKIQKRKSGITAYKLFIKDFHKQHKALGKQSFVGPGESMKAAGAAWKSLSEEKKSEYERRILELRNKNIVSPDNQEKGIERQRQDDQENKEDMACDSDAAVVDIGVDEIEEEDEEEDNNIDFNDNDRVEQMDLQPARAQHEGNSADINVQYSNQQPAQVQGEEQNAAASIGQAGDSVRIKREEDSENETPHATTDPGDPQEVMILGQSDAESQNPLLGEQTGKKSQTEHRDNLSDEVLQDDDPSDPVDNVLRASDDAAGGLDDVPPVEPCHENTQTENPSNLTNETPPAENNSANQATAPNASASGFVDTKESGLLFNEIRGRLANAKGRLEKNFYGPLKHHVAELLFHNGRLSLSDYNRTRGYMHDFQSCLNKLDDRENDHYDRCAYEGLAMGFTNDCQAHFAANHTIATESSSDYGATSDSATLFTSIKESLSEAIRPNDKVFYRHLKQYLSKKLSFHKGHLLRSDAEKVKGFVGEFKSLLCNLDDTSNDPDDVRAYEGLIKGTIHESQKELQMPDNM